MLLEAYPIVGLECYGKGVYKVVRKCKGKLQGRIPERNSIMKCSKSSLIRLMAIVQSTDVEFKSMLTLTYPVVFPQDGLIVKSDIAAWLQKVRRQNLGEYLWFLEFQERGAPHFHMLLQIDKITPKLRADFGLYWANRIAQSDWFIQACEAKNKDYIKNVINVTKVACHELTLVLIREPDGAKKYATKYATKERQKKVPRAYANVGRFWGASTGVKPEIKFIDTYEEELRIFLDERGYEAAKYEEIPKYIW